jgi:hypothetical protein
MDSQKHENEAFRHAGVRRNDGVEQMMHPQKVYRMASLQSSYTRNRAFPGAKSYM